VAQHNQTAEARRSEATSAHTPGPWSNERIWDTPASRIHARVHGVPVALAEAFTMRGAGEKEANARLIAAAPELLAACKALHQAIDVMLAWRIEHERGFMPTQLPQWPAVVAAHAAITKAEGRS
jgi:hypothetical protein